MPLRMSPVTGSVLLACAAIVLCSGLQAWRLFSSVSHPRLEPRVWSPGIEVPAIHRCAECHPGACEHIAAAPHGTTLHSGNEPWIRERFAGKSFQLSAEGATVSFWEREGALWMGSASAPEALRVDWMFGSGRHAQTPVSLLVNPDGATELIEGSVSWYSAGGLGLSPGAETTDARGMRCLGIHQDHRTALECFGCHVTQLPVERGRIRTDAMVRGVTCARCHPGGEEHLRAMQQGDPDSMERWSTLTPLESINRCGECHRRADQLTPAELQPERTVLVRFASVGLAMSRCFQEQGADETPDPARRLDCLTCHDPHQSAEKSAAFYTAKCLHCHETAESQAGICKAVPTGENCLSCHMPGVSVADKLVLTDHWIRVRKATDPPASRADR